MVFSDIPGRTSSEHYQCRVKFEKEDESGWRDVFVPQTEAKSEEGYYSTLWGFTASWIAFESDFNGDNVVVEISKKDGLPITEAMIRPSAHPYPAIISEGKAYVTFSGPANVNVDINGAMEKNYTGYGYNGPKLHTISLFANPLFRQPNKTNPKVVVLEPGIDIKTLSTNRSQWDTLVFAPGIHSSIDTVFTIHSNEVIYIPGDAIFKGTIHAKNQWGVNASQNFSIYGSGTISGEDLVRLPHKTNYKNIFRTISNQAEGAHLEGFVVIDPAFHTFLLNNSSDNPDTKMNIFKNLKILAWRVNSDGLNVFRHAEVSDCFFRTQDDSFYYGQKNVHIHDNVVWNDANGALLYNPAITDGSTGTFENITSIYDRSHWHWWDGGRTIELRETRPGTGVFKNVLVKNILIEDPYPAFPPFNFFMNEGAGEVVFENVVFENIHQPNPAVSEASWQLAKPRNTMKGLDNDRNYENITFRNCFYGGKWLGSFGDGDFDTTFVDKNTVVFELANNFPIASFKANKTTITINEEVYFSDLSSNFPDSWHWTFEGGNPSTSSDKNPKVLYSAPGNYEVSLKTSNPFGSNTHVIKGFITVNQLILNINSESQPQLSIYPNPAQETIHVVVQEDVTEKTIKLYSINGSLLMERQFLSELTIDIRALNFKGICIIEIINNHQKIYTKVILN